MTPVGNNIDNFQCYTDHKLQSQKYLGRQCLPLPLIKSAYDNIDDEISRQYLQKRESLLPEMEQ